MKKFFRSQDGQDLIEYTLLLAFLALCCVSTFTGLGDDINAIWTSLASRLANP